MAMIRVNPTRMELTRLKKRLTVAVRGHKLLKDKRDEMMRRFIELAHRNYDLRKEVEAQLSQSLKGFTMAGAAMSPEAMEEALLYPARSMELTLSERNIMGVRVPGISAKETSISRGLSYGLVFTSSELDGAISRLSDLLPSLLELAEVEKTCNRLADEIEKTRRRVNALEYVQIPQLEETIRSIAMKLEENERGNLTRLMKVKSMLAERG